MEPYFAKMKTLKKKMKNLERQIGEMLEPPKFEVKKQMFI
jgi:hypothetical protein